MSVTTLSGCDIGKLTVNTTSKVLTRGQPAMKQESDFILAQRAIPASLKTVETFHMVDPTNKRLKLILAEGFCQYASGFVEDEWELATLARDFDAIELHSSRATKSFTRCLGYALQIIGDSFSSALWGNSDGFESALAKVKRDNRTPLMWIAVGLAGSINQNKHEPEMLVHLPKVRLILERIVSMDSESPPKDLVHRAMPHLVLGMLDSAMSKEYGGKPERAREHMLKAFELTEKRFLLAKVYMARRYAVSIQDAALFRKLLIQVLQTDPAIWPEQRLANEIAHRRAKRYLKNEKEWF